MLRCSPRDSRAHRQGPCSQITAGGGSSEPQPAFGGGNQPSYGARLSTTSSKTLVCAKGLRALSLQRSPGQVASQILPEALQAPDHMQLPVRKMFQEAIADEPRDILPIVVAFISQLLLKHGANGNHCGERIPEDDKLHKESATQQANACCQ